MLRSEGWIIYFVLALRCGASAEAAEGTFKRGANDESQQLASILSSMAYRAARTAMNTTTNLADSPMHLQQLVFIMLDMPPEALDKANGISATTNTRAFNVT